MLATLKRLAAKLFSAAETEAFVLETLHNDVRATVRRLEAIDPGLRALLERSYAYAVFPAVGKASAVVGGAYGKGEVFRGDKLIGYAAVVQLTLGVQLGGQTFTQVVAFESKEALDRFKRGTTAFAANASAVAVAAGAAASARFDRGAAVFVYADGGLMLEAAIGGQRLFFRPAVLGRTRKAPTPRKPRRPSRRPATSKKSARTAKKSTTGRRRTAAGRSRA
jgi:lipid-binding SYLF domain-containing protein